MENQTQKHFTVIGWRLNSQQKEELRKRGLYAYANRSWDEGSGCTLEHRVIVNHTGDVITNWPALDENNKDDFKNDFYKYIREVGATETSEFYNSIEDILDMN